MLIMARKASIVKKNKATVTGGNKYITTPESARLFVTVDKARLKGLKRLAVDSEQEVDDLLRLAVDLLLQIYEDTPLEELEKNGKNAFFDRIGLKK